MSASKKNPRANIQAYLDTWTKRGATASEGDLYDVFATHIVRGIFGYTNDEYNITPRGKRGSGSPDLRLKTKDGTPWVAVEAKVDDRLIRSESQRDRLWRDKRKYVDDQTAYFLWVAPKTILICKVSGEPICGLQLENGQPELDLDIADQVWHAAHTDAEIYQHLAPISAQAGRELKYLERFQAGELPYGYIPVSRETVDKLTSSLSGCVNILLGYLQRSQVRLKQAYQSYEAERPQFEEQIEALTWNYQGGELEAQRRIALRRFERAHASAIRFHQAFEDFCGEQAYTKYEKQRNENEQAALERIFRANAAYVAIGRLLFVRLAEDQGLIKPKISNGGLEAWNKVLGNGDLVARWVGLAFADAQRVCRQLFAETPFDVLMPVDDVEFDQALLRVVYRLNAFDLSGLSNDVDVLGAIYQGILDRKLRKDVGEFYTDQEVVEYILSRVGLREVAQQGAQVRLLDPACGSGAFLVRAAGILREEDAKRGIPKPDVQERIGSAIHGLDINHFAVYIADMNLLFATFDLTAETRQPARFSVHRVNSLLRDIHLRLTESGSTRENDPVQDAVACREADYQFVVGNPPYVRAERLPDDDRLMLKESYKDVHGGGNVDLAVCFVRRALEWLQPGGRLGLILPRSIADAGFAAPLRRILESEDYTMEELVPLDWACHELFDSDVVPFLLFVRKTPRPKGHKVTLVQCVRSKDDLLARAGGYAPTGTRTSKISWAAFARHSKAGWPLDITPEDIPTLDALRKFPRLDTVAVPHSGIKAGSTGAARDLVTKLKLDEGWRPMITGSEIHAFSTEQARRAVFLQKAVDRSIWAPMISKGSEASIPEAVVALSKIYITLNAAVVDCRSVCCQDNAVLVAPLPGRIETAYALAGLLNTRVVRYSVFLLGRAGVAGGGRRDFTIYPRTLSAISVPDLSSVGWTRLDRLSRVAHENGALRAEADAEIWGKCVGRKTAVLVREWPLDFAGWPDGPVLTAKSFEPVLDKEKCALHLDPDLCVRGDLTLLRYLTLHLNAYFDEADELSKSSFLKQKVAQRSDAAAVLADFQSALQARSEAERRYWRAVELMDHIVEKGFGLSDSQRATVARRMTEFPLSDTANKPRLPWETSKKPRGRQFTAGERYHSQ